MKFSSNGIFEQVKNHARGQWPAIFETFGIQIPPKKKQGPCPCCGGTDRFVFDDKYGRGDSYCRQCDKKSRDGIELLADFAQIRPYEAAKQIAQQLGINTTPNSQLDLTKLLAANKKKRAEQAKIEADKETKKLIEGGIKAQWVIDNYCQPANESQEYLKRKKIQPHGVYMLKKSFKNTYNNPEAKCSKGHVFPAGTLMVPVYGEHGLQALQLIPRKDFKSTKGEKRYLSGTGPKNCGRFVLGNLVNKLVIWICEGFATAATIYEQTGQAVVCAFSSNLIPAMAESLKKDYPESEIRIATDNDSHKKRAGEKAARATGLPWSMPEEHGFDWNDLYVSGGDVKTSIEKNLQYPPKPVEALPATEARIELNRVAQLVFNRKHPKLNDTFLHAIIKGAAGLGKTTIMVAMAKQLPKGRFIEYYCQSIGFAEDVAANYKASGVSARVIRGREQRLNGVPMCRRHKAAKALGNAGASVYSSLCEKKVGDSVIQCPYFKACPYIDQFKGNETVRIYPTTRFTMQRGAVDKLEKIPVCAIVDEAFYQVSTKITHIKPDTIKDSCISPEAKNILDSWLNTGVEPEWCNVLEEALASVGETFNEPNINPDTPEEFISNVLESFKPEKAMYALLSNLGAKSLPECERNPHAIEVIQNKFFSVVGLAPVTRMNYKLENEYWRIPVINLDASADPEVIKNVTGFEWELHEIAAKRENVHFTQVNKSFSKTQLGLVAHFQSNETAQAKSEALRAELLRFIEAKARQHEKVLLVTYKALEDLWEGLLPINVDVEHFGNLRGKDQYKDHDALIQIGHNQPSEAAMRELSRAIYHEPTGHKRQLERLIRDSETEQSVDRLRLIRNTKQRHVYLLTCHIPNSIQPDTVLSWSEAKGAKTTNDQLVNDIVSRFGGVPMSGKFLADHAPDLVGSEGNARLLLLRKIKPQLVKKVALQNPIEILIGNCNGQNINKKPVKMVILNNISSESLNSKLVTYGWNVLEPEEITLPQPEKTMPKPCTPEPTPPQPVGAQLTHRTACGAKAEITTEVLIGRDIVKPPRELTFTGQFITGYQDSHTRVVAELVIDNSLMTMVHAATDRPVSIMEFLNKAKSRWCGRLSEIRLTTKPEGWPEIIYIPPLNNGVEAAHRL